MSCVSKIMDGNEAVASIAYRVTEISAIYPITPSTPMGELADQWSAEGKLNIWGTVPQVVELQSEGGASGSLHGALQTGALATTYTASQGLLLMIPNMYKIAGELTPLVIHVSARSLAAQGLSIFGDHSDVMSVRGTGFAMLCAGNVQEAHDFALITHASTLESRIPFIHFFEGFRTSHELNRICVLNDDVLHEMIDDELVAQHRQRALNPEKPCIRGTAQNPDVYFQGRETVNPFYDKVVDVVEQQMEKFGKIAGRKYKLMNYYGPSDAEKVIVIMGSGSKVAEETVARLQQQGEKVGVLQVILYRPFSIKHFLQALPKTVRSIAVLDRVKEPGSLGEPLYQDVVTALMEAQANNELHFANGMPQVICGRYGLSSKEFTPAMVKGIFDEMSKAKPKNHFTVGINDDVTHSSIDYDPSFITESAKNVKAIFFGLGSDGTVGANKNTIKIIGEGTDNFAQGYFVYDSKKAGSKTVSHLRFGPELIDSPYLLQEANFIGCHQFNFITTSNVLSLACEGATFLLNTHYSIDEVWQHLPRVIQETIIAKKIKFYVIDGYKVAQDAGMGNRVNTIMQTCFFAISGVLPREEAINKIKEAIAKTYKRKGEEVIKKNYEAVDKTLANLHEVKVPSSVSANAVEFEATLSAKAPEFVKKVLGPIMSGFGDDLPVSAMPIDGTFPTATTQWEKRSIAQFVPQWNSVTCIQCGQCSVICPHAAIRAKRITTNDLAKAPEGFVVADIRGNKGDVNDKFRLQIYVDDCTGCGLCTMVCPVVDKANLGVKAVTLVAKDDILAQERKNEEFFASLPYANPCELSNPMLKDMQYIQPLFEFSGACAGCGETPYVKLISQLFGDRMMVANATGCSSIYGGNLPTTPWAVNNKGCGPAWCNSLFEDNAEFGFGFRVACDTLQQHALELLTKKASLFGDELVNAIKAGVEVNDTNGIEQQRQRVAIIKAKLASDNDSISKQLFNVADYLIPRSVWLMGGDGWAYDIGFGGLDHVLANGKNVNIMVLDTEVYSNTGGQASKSTPRGAIAKFAVGGKELARKDLGLMATTYGNVYVAQIAIGANPNQALKAIREAEAYPGTSLIIAYSHCVAHGYEIKKGIEQQKLAVNSGFWPLYRYNPMLIAQGQNPFQLDSAKPTVPVDQYAYNEARFKALKTSNPAQADLLMQALQRDVEARWQSIAKMAEKKAE